MTSGPTAPQSVPALLERNALIYGAKPAFREKEFGIWQSWTWLRVNEEVRSMALGFLALGLNPGDHVAVIGRNRPALYWAMVAIQKAGAVPVPLYQDAIASTMRSISAWRWPASLWTGRTIETSRSAGGVVIGRSAYGVAAAA